MRTAWESNLIIPIWSNFNLNLIFLTLTSIELQSDSFEMDCFVAACCWWSVFGAWAHKHNPSRPEAAGYMQQMRTLLPLKQFAALLLVVGDLAS